MVVRLGALSAWHSGTVCGQTPKPLSLELLVPNLGSTWPLSSSFLSMQGGCKLIDVWQDYTITSCSCNWLGEAETFSCVFFVGTVGTQRPCPVHVPLPCFIPWSCPCITPSLVLAQLSLRTVLKTYVSWFELNYFSSGSLSGLINNWVCTAGRGREAV